jgi:cytochrome c biogenesis protein
VAFDAPFLIKKRCHGRIGMSQAEGKLSPKARFSIFASVKLTIVLMALIGSTVLLGAWCPQESAVGAEKVFEQFGDQWGRRMIEWGIADIFHSPVFLGLIGLLTVNMIVASCQRVFPKVRTLYHPMPFVSSSAIEKMSARASCSMKASARDVIEQLQRKLKKRGYNVRVKGDQLTAEKGKIGRLAATITHIGLLTLLAGVTITSWTGFSGFQPVPLAGSMTFDRSEHSKLWLGSLPKWTVHVDATRREDYENGNPRQWYSTLTVFDASGKMAKTQEISVNNPLSYDNVDIYQSSWGMDHVLVSFNDHVVKADLRQMGKTNAAFMPLDGTTILILSVRDQVQPMKIFAKIPEWQEPRILALVKPGETVKLGEVRFKYEKCVPVTGLQYKSDPGLPITYMAFAFITTGVLLAAIPHRQIWAQAAQAEDGKGAQLALGGMSRKAKRAFENEMRKIIGEFALETPAAASASAVPVVELAGAEKRSLAAKDDEILVVNRQ